MVYEFKGVTQWHEFTHRLNSGRLMKNFLIKENVLIKILVKN